MWIENMLPLLVFGCGCVVPITLGAIIASSDTHDTPPGFGKPLSASRFQTWQDWMRKRDHVTTSLGQGRFKSDDLQPWYKFVAKRGFGLPDSSSFGTLSSNKLQSWSNWINKKGFGISRKFPGSPGLPYDNLQGWSNYISKRGFGIGGRFPGLPEANKDSFQHRKMRLQRRGFRYQHQFLGICRKRQW